VQPETSTPWIQTIARATAARARRAALGALLAALALAGAAGCRTTREQELPLLIQVTAPRDGVPLFVAAASAAAEPATVTAAESGAEDAPRALGRAPFTIDRLVIVRWRSISGEVRYWLRNDGGLLPRNPRRPPFADARYDAGADYPLDLRFTAGGAGEWGEAGLLLDARRLEQLFQEPAPFVKVELKPRRPASAAPPAGANMPRPR
jgi:hypothetical protein